jgi:probable phosphoglycerate mutase
MVTIYLIRHAESLGNVNLHLIGGQSNHYPLTDRGYEQARLLGQRLWRERYTFDRVYASTAIRAMETARVACGYLDIPQTDLTLTPDILELSQGEWEGLVRKDIYTPEVLAAMRAESLTFRAPGGESQADVAMRMMRWLRQALDEIPAEGPYAIAAFSHGFAIRSLVRHILDADPSMAWRMVTHNTSLTVLEYRRDQYLLERMNDFAHLTGTDFIGHY